MKKSRDMSMLEYCKIILGKMKFSRKLFRKEYRKTFQYLEPAEHSKLKQWLRQEEPKTTPSETNFLSTSAN